MAGSETPVWGSLFNKVASLTTWTHLTLLEGERATGGVLQEKVFLEISQNPQEMPVPESYFQ